MRIPQIIPSNQCAYCESCDVFVDSLRKCHNCDNGNHLVPMAEYMNPPAKQRDPLGAMRDLIAERDAQWVTEIVKDGNKVITTDHARELAYRIRAKLAQADKPQSPAEKKTNREAHEEAAGMGLCPEFFRMNKIDPDAPYQAQDLNGNYILDSREGKEKRIGQPGTNQANRSSNPC